MREKLETLSLAQLRQIAKDLEIKSITGKKKAELIESIIEENKAREDSASQDAEGAVKETPTYQAPARQEGYQRRGAPSQEGFQRRSAAALEGTMRKPSFSGASAQRGQAPVSAPRGAASASASRAPASAAEPRQPSVAPNINPEELQNLDSGIPAHGILEVMPDGFGFIRCENYMPGDNDVYVSPSQIRRFNLKTGDIVSGSQRVKTSAENEEFFIIQTEF